MSGAWVYEHPENYFLKVIKYVLFKSRFYLKFNDFSGKIWEFTGQKFLLLKIDNAVLNCNEKFHKFPKLSIYIFYSRKMPTRITTWKHLACTREFIKSNTSTIRLFNNTTTSPYSHIASSNKLFIPILLYIYKHPCKQRGAMTWMQTRNCGECKFLLFEF